MTLPIQTSERDPAAAMTEHLLVQAGIESGMRILDVGCGLGKVSAIASGLVGPTGSVVGIDRESSVLEQARALGLENATFVEGDFLSVDPTLGPFDAAIGRRVLMYQSDPVEAVRKLRAWLKPGSIIAFEEMDGAPPLNRVSLPLHERVRAWVWAAVERERVVMTMGSDLYSVFSAAGLSDIEVRAQAIVHTPNTNHPTAAIVGYMIPRMVAQGVITAEEVEIETLEDRLRAELVSADGPWLGDMVFGAWGRSG